MTRFVFPQPPPAQLRFPQQQQQTSPLQLLQTFAALRGQQEARQEKLRTQGVAQEREKLQLRKLQLDVARQEREATRADTREELAPVIAEAASPQLSEAEAAREELRIRDPELFLELQSGLTEGDKANAERLQRTRQDFLRRSVEARRGLFAFRKSGLIGDPAAWNRVRQHLASAGLDINALPQQNPGLEQLNQLEETLKRSVDILYQPGDFQTSDAVAKSLEEQGKVPGTPEFEGLYKSAFAAEQKRKAQGRRITLVQPGEGVPAARGALSKGQVEWVANNDMDLTLRTIENVLLAPDERGGQMYVRLLGIPAGFKKTALEWVDAINDPDFSDLVFSKHTENDYAMMQQLGMDVTMLVQSYRRMVTGLAAPEAELKRIESLLQTRSGPRKFLSGMNALRWALRRQMFIREKLMIEGVGKQSVTRQELLDAQTRRLNNQPATERDRAIFDKWAELHRRTGGSLPALARRNAASANSSLIQEKFEFEQRRFRDRLRAERPGLSGAELERQSRSLSLLELRKQRWLSADGFNKLNSKIEGAGRTFELKLLNNRDLEEIGPGAAPPDGAPAAAPPGGTPRASPEVEDKIQEMKRRRREIQQQQQQQQQQQ